MKTTNPKTGKLKRISKRKQSPKYQGGIKATHRMVWKEVKNKDNEYVEKWVKEENI
jgi:hypothetical protein